MTRYFRTGEHVTLRYHHDGDVNFEAAVIVAQDSAIQTMRYLPAGAPIRAKLLVDGTVPPRDISYTERKSLDRVLGDLTWETNNALIASRPDWHFDVRLFWKQESGTFAGWYVNLQDPLMRTEEGFTSVDHLLDVWITPDGEWAWKDEREIEEAIDLGVFTLAQATRMRAAGNQAVSLMQSRARPFTPALTTWKPPNDWPLPSFPNHINCRFGAGTPQSDAAGAV